MDSEIDTLVGWMSRVFKPKGPDKKLREIILLTWDTEYKLPYLFPNPEDFEKKYGFPYPRESEEFFQRPLFITHQLGAQLPNGEIVAEGIKVDRALSRKEFLSWVHECSEKMGNKVAW